VISIIVFALLGAALSSVLACVPSLHVYNVMGLLVVAVHSLAARGVGVPGEILVPFATGLVVGYSILSTIPSVVLAAPDESALFMVLPGQKFLMAGRGYEGTLLTALGGVAGLFLLILVAGPLAPKMLPVARAVFQPHSHWIIWCVICFMLMSEWPKGGGTGQGGWRRFFTGWKTLGAGLATFLLAGLLGFILLYRSPISYQSSFLNLMPAFVGLFALPWLLLNIVNRTPMPPQTLTAGAVDAHSIFRGSFAGALGGGFASFFPAVTGGVGGLLAGHATALRNDRVFLISQGTSKLIYYTGSFMLFFVPGLRMTRGGAAWMLRGLYVPRDYHDYYMVLAAIAIAGAACIALLSPLTRGMLALIAKHGFVRISSVALVVVVAIVVAATGWTGVGIMLVGTGIGLIPVLYGSRRMNCLGIILLPIACNMSGVGAGIAGWLGLT